MPATYEPIASQTLAANTTTLTLSSIPSGFTDLVLVMRATNTLGANDLALRFNSDSASNYSATYIYGDGASAVSGRSSSQTSIPAINNSGSGVTIVYNIMSYANANVFKTAVSAHSDAARIVVRQVALWRDTAAITSITISTATAEIGSGSTFSLYGIKAA